MRIFIQSPNINSRHGGIRVINEWANRLQAFGHKVILYNQAGPVRCDWMTITCKIVNTTSLLDKSDLLIITSPHGAFLLAKDKPAKKVVFLQMLEHLFNITNKSFFDSCLALYTTKYPLISISQWNIKFLQNKYQRKGPIHYVGNGVNLDDFSISNKPKEGKIALLESPEPTNMAKDTEKIAVQVAKNLIEKGWTIKGFGLQAAKDNIYTEYFTKPSLEIMNRLYDEATIMIKATKYDARSTAPLEAGTKGTVTIRGIIEGDDDLNDSNSFKTGYSYDKLFDATMFAINNPEQLKQRSENIKAHVQTYTWDYWMAIINQILCSL
jgi:hypothetical protein